MGAEGPCYRHDHQPHRAGDDDDNDEDDGDGDHGGGGDDGQ